MKKTNYRLRVFGCLASILVAAGTLFADHRLVTQGNGKLAIVLGAEAQRSDLDTGLRCAGVRLAGGMARSINPHGVRLERVEPIRV